MKKVVNECIRELDSITIRCKELRNRISSIEKECESFDYTSIKTVEDACKRLGIDPPDISGLSKDEVSYLKLKLVTKAINNGWEPDFSDQKQYKWYPYFFALSDSYAGLVYSFSDCAALFTNASIGSRLCFESREKSDYAGRQFTELYEGFLL